MGAQEKKSVKRHRRHNLKERFEIVKTLGQGTYGKVKLAVEKSTRTKYAIKSIRKNKIETEQDLIRVRREIEIMATLNHPNITMVHEVFENKDRIVLVIEYAEGGELYDYINERQGLYEDEARKFFRQITAAVHYLHSNGVVHRDLKLENILLDGCGNVKIADFGLSNVYGDNTLLNTFCGSPLYASPEIVNGQPYCGPEVDCWSLGVVLYTLVYGAMPFDGSDFKKLKQQITHGDYFEPRNPSDASGLIRQLLCTSVPGRATVSDICSHWWVNFGYDHTPAQIAQHQGTAVDQLQLHDALKIPYSSEDSDTESAPVVTTATVAMENKLADSAGMDTVVAMETSTGCDGDCSAGTSTQTDSLSHHPTPQSSSSHSHNVLTSQQVPLKGILKKPRQRRNSQGSADTHGASKDLVQDIPKKRRPQSDCFVDATWLNLAPDSHLSDADWNTPTKPVFDSTKKPKRGILKNKNSNGSQGSNNGNKDNQHSRSDSGCVIDEQLNLYSALEKFEVALPLQSPRENQRDSAYGGDSRKPSCDSDLGSHEPSNYGFAEIENVLDQIVNFDVVQNTQSQNTKCSPNSSGHASQPFSRPESDEFEATPSTSGELLDQTDSPKLEPVRYRKRPLKSILKRNSKSKKDSWRHSLGSQGSNSSADILDFSYDSCDGEHFMQEYCTVPIPLNEGEGDGKPSAEKQPQDDHWSEFEVMPWQEVDVPLNDSMQLVESECNSGSFAGNSIERLVQVVEKLESDTNQLSGSRSSSDSESDTVSPPKEHHDDFHDYANLPCDNDSQLEALVIEEYAATVDCAAITNCVQSCDGHVREDAHAPPPLPERPPPIGAPASPPQRPETPPPLPETPPPPFKTHELDLFEFDMLEFEQTASEMCSSRESTVQLDSLDGLIGDLEGCGEAHADVAFVTSDDVMTETLDVVVDTDKHRLSDLIADLQECAAQGNESLAEVCPAADQTDPFIKPLTDTDVSWSRLSACERRSKVKRQWSVPTDLMKTDVEKFSVDKTVPVELASPEFLQCIDVYNLEIAAYFNERKPKVNSKDFIKSIPIPSCCHSNNTTAQCSEDNQVVDFEDAIVKESSSSESEASSEDEAGAGEFPQLFIEEENLNDVTDVKHFDDIGTLLIENENCPCGGEEFSMNNQMESELHNFVNELDMNQANLALSSPDLQRKNCPVEIPTHTFESLKDDVFTPIEQTKVSLDDIMRRIDLLGAKIDTELQSTSNMQTESPFIDHQEATEVLQQAIDICQNLN